MKQQTDMSKMVESMRRYIQMPEAFVREVIQADPDEWQVEALNVLVSRGRLSVRAGHGVGKSAFEAWAVLWFLFTRPYPKVICTAPSKQQLFDILWPEIAKWMQGSPILKKLFEWQKTRIVMTQHPERWWASARTASKPDNFAGIHEDHVLIVCDEASGIADTIYEVAEGALTTPDAKIILCGNPTQTTGEFYDSFHSRVALYHTMHVSCIGSKRVTQSYIDNLKSKYGEQSQVYRVRVLGEFPEAEPDVLIPLEFVERAVMTDLDDGRGSIVLGVDVARYGDDSTVIYPRIGPVMMEPERHFKLSVPEVTGNVIACGERVLRDNPRPVITVNVDVGVMGAGVVDELIQQTRGRRTKWIINAINFGGISDDPDCDDKATEMYKHARDLMEHREIHLPKHDLTTQQLCTRKYRMTIKGKLKLEPKDEYKKRTHESPDFADACVLCLMESAVNVSRDMQTAKVKPVTAGLNKMRF